MSFGIYWLTSSYALAGACDFIPQNPFPVEIDTYSLSMATYEFYDIDGKLAASNGSDELKVTNTSLEPLTLRFFIDIDIGATEDGGFSLITRDDGVYPPSSSYLNGQIWSTTHAIRPGESFVREVMYFTPHLNPPGEWTKTYTKVTTLDLIIFDESGTCALSRYKVRMQAEATDINQPD